MSRIVAILVLCLIPVAAAAEGPDMLIVTPKDLVEPAGVLAAHRGAGGLNVKIEVLEDLVKGGVAGPESMRDHIRELYGSSGGRLKFLLLMGDGPDPERDEMLGRMRIPPKIVKPRYTDTRWPYDKEIASDTWYALMDDDLMPELAVGRLPADRKSDALVMVKKIIAYEKSRDFGPWRKKVNVIAGTGGFGPMVDAFLEGTFRKYMTELLDPAFDVTLTYGNPNSPYCFPPPRFSSKVVERINAGSLVTAYVGHGSPRRFDSIRWAGRRFPICDSRAVEGIDVRNGSPVVVIIACSTGQFDSDKGDCISEKMIELEGGPVAVLSSTRISHPYANGILGRTLIIHLMQGRHDTLGEAVLEAKKAMLTDKGKEQKVLDRFAMLIMKPKTLQPNREDHMHLYNLLGDPAMAMGFPRGRASLKAGESASLGEEIEIFCELDGKAKGEAVVTLEAKRGTILEALKPLKDLEGEEALDAMARNWEKANHLVVATAVEAVEGDRFEARIRVPKEGIPGGEYFLKVYVKGEEKAYLGHAPILIEGEEEEGEEEEEEDDGF